MAKPFGRFFQVFSLASLPGEKTRWERKASLFIRFAVHAAEN